jgi:apolipoprotein N-acyltransferase
MLLACLSGLLLSLAWLGFPGWILWFALLPLLYLDDYYVAVRKSVRSVSFFGYAFVTFLVWNLLTTWWIKHATLVGALTAIILNAFAMGLIVWLAHTARRRFSGTLGYLALMVFYLSFEWIHYHWDLEWPWLTLGNGFANQVKMIQWYEFTGVFGGSLWVLSVNILLFRILKNLVNKNRTRGFYVSVLSLGVVVGIPILLSARMYHQYTEKEDPREIVVVQPNIDPYNESHDLAFSNQVLQKFVHLALSKTTPETDVILGPETIFEQYWDEETLEYNSQYRDIARLLEKTPGSDLMFGASTLKYYQPGDTLPETARVRELSNGQKRVFDIFNTALYLRSGSEPQIYHKSILVSGVEKIPYLKYLGFLQNFIIDLGGTSGSLGKQGEPANFIAHDGTRIAPAICYESIFGAYIADFVKQGARYIFIITNDGWWKDTPGYKQHMSYARLRAIETRRSIARAANTGISCFINQRGDILQKTGWWEDAAIREKLNGNGKITFYVQAGDYIPRIASFLSVLLILLLLVQKVRRTG